MTLNIPFIADKKISLPLSLVGAFIVLNFTPELTKIKNLTVILMAITAIYFLIKNRQEAIRPLKNTLFYSICLFVVVMLYSVFISIDPALSFKSLNKPVLNSLLLFSFLLPIVLHKNTATQIARMVLVSVVIGLVLVYIRDLALYVKNYAQGIIPFTELSHRDFSDSYVFCFPVILCIWHLYKKNSVAHWSLFLSVSAVTVIFMLGTFARGAWLAALAMSVIIIIVNREKTLALLGAALLICGALLLLSYDNAQDHPLTKKMEQTSSSNRYSGGTQGTALELILQNPLKGYGYGNDLFHRVYNSQVADHPHWIYKKSLGPHNIFLAIWFAAGIFGLIAAIMMGIAALHYAIRTYKENKHNAIATQTTLFLLVSFIGWFIVRGNFENVYLNILGIHFGLLIALGFSLKKDKSVE